MRTKSRAASNYIFFTSIVLFVGIGYLSLILHKGHMTAKEELSHIQRQLENGEINIYDDKGRLDPLVIENIYRHNDTIDYITLYRQKNILATGGSEPAISIDNQGMRQYQHFWWQKVVRTYFPDPLHDQNYSVDMVVDIIPQSVLKNALLSCVVVLGTLLLATSLYSLAYSKVQKKKHEAQKKTAEKEMPVPLVAETGVTEKAPVSMDVPIEQILGPQVVDEFFSGLDRIEELEAERIRRGISGYGEIPTPGSVQNPEDADSGFFDEQETNEASSQEENVSLASEEQSDSDIPDDLPELPEPSDLDEFSQDKPEDNLDDLGKELLPEVVTAAEISESLDSSPPEMPDDVQGESAEDSNSEAQDDQELLDLPELPEEDTQEEAAEDEIEDLEELPELPDLPSENSEEAEDSLDDLPDLDELIEDEDEESLEELSEISEESAQSEDIQEEESVAEDEDEIEDLEELSELPELPEDDFEAENKTETEEESFPELAEALSEEEAQQEEEINEELPVLDDEDEISLEETEEQDEQAEEVAEDLIPIEDLTEESAAQENELEALEDLPQMEDLLGPDSVAREDDADDIDDLPDLDNLLMAEEMEEKGLAETSTPAAFELSDNMLQELTSTPDAGLKNLSSDFTDDEFDAVLADIEAKDDQTYLPNFETDSRFPEPPLLKGMSTAKKPAKKTQPVSRRPPMHVPVLLELEKEKLPKGIFKCTAVELEEAANKTDWRESLSSILLDAEEMEEDFSLVLFALADEKAGKDVVNKYFTQEHGLTLHRFSEHSFGIWLINTDLEGAYGIAGEFVYFMEEQRLVTAVGLSAKSDRLVRSEHLVKETSHALSRAIASGGGIVGFRSDPRKYARVTVDI